MMEVEQDTFTAQVFSWSIEDIFNEYLYKNKVQTIPESFDSVEHYFGSFVNPLLEETRAQLQSSMDVIHRAPYAEVVTLEKSKRMNDVYEVRVNDWRNRNNDRGNEPYKTIPGDLFVLVNGKPESVSDLQRDGWSWLFASATKILDDENEENYVNDRVTKYFKVKTSKLIEETDEMQGSFVIIFLMNLIANRRIWKALHMSRNLKIIKEVMSIDPGVLEKCNHCDENNDDGIWGHEFVESLSSELNKSQTQAVLACLQMIYSNSKFGLELIWGPPGTGKTKTLSTLLFKIRRMNYRILVCAPTNVAIIEVASRVQRKVIEAEDHSLFSPLGDILLFGNKERLKMKVDSDIEDIYLDYRVERLTECLLPVTGWRSCIPSLINFLENCVSEYHIFLENELITDREQKFEFEIKEGFTSEAEVSKKKYISFLEFASERFVSMAVPLRRCISILCTHVPKTYILEHNFDLMVSCIKMLDSFESLLFQDNLVSREVEVEFKSFKDKSSVHIVKSECLSVLKSLHHSLSQLSFPDVRKSESIQEFCFQRASLVFCTASSSFKLHRMNIDPLNVVVIDEAAQLKECESTIPLQLPGVRRAILVGDECQLPATVQSKVSAAAGFGRSLFERLSAQGLSKQLLNMQYRMHPSISFFPDSKIYHHQIQDAPIVRSKSYEKHYLPGPMFGPYSFINVIGGRDEKDDDGHSRKNMVEVAAMLGILRNLYKAFLDSKQKLNIGVISPYAAQVVAIREKLGKKFDKIDGFQVKVKTVDGFQGGEEDIIIISTVRSTSHGSLDFISNPQRVNVSLTRARQSLWILGDARTLASSQSIWEDLVLDAKRRRCFFDADEDKDLAKAIFEVKKEFDQLDDLLRGDSMLFKNSRWKVIFSDNFLKSFRKLTSVRMKSSTVNLLLRLSSGWRPKKQNVDLNFGSTLQILKQYKVEGLYVVCSTDIVKEFSYTQVLKIWDLLPQEEIPKLLKRLESIFGKYTDDFINRCNEKYLDGKLEVPKSWPPSLDVIRFKDLTVNETSSDLADTSDGRSYVENSKISESLLLMKFYPLSATVVNHLLSDHDGRELSIPFEVTDQEKEMILFRKSSFIIGRSGTGKTTVLTMKLYQNEQLSNFATEGFRGENYELKHLSNKVEKSLSETTGTVLRQLFVTVSPKLCAAVKQHLSHLKSFMSNSVPDSIFMEVDDMFDEGDQFQDTPDSFIDIPSKSFPLVITFHKFLMMLDGTLGNSYFGRFFSVRSHSNLEVGTSSSVVLQTLLRRKEVNYESFISSYWPHFNSNLTKSLDPSRVFTEIISSIKGGLRAIEATDGRLNREEYVRLSEARTSSLSSNERGMVYDIFISYEKMKMEEREFDIADLVINLHFRLKDKGFQGVKMDFVYIDEVQDLTMSQIALFRHICNNVEEGFVFSGDTAQTIARGIDFRFEDIRHLFYEKFIMKSRSIEHVERIEKGKISDLFQLTQNFRTHNGILKLSQSIIELLYHFFPLSIDELKPETSMIYGEAPILMECGTDENAMIKIFGNGKANRDIVGFGAEQVIIVRDNNARKEISPYTGKQALVLTILECKGLEFQDVLLYNFFGSSPLRNHWRVIYNYLKDQIMLESTSQRFPNFSMLKHNILCSELKQLYVAVTRTRQRLWICENEGSSEPMFEYWKRRCLVQVRRLDDSVAKAMQVASSPEEWKSRGKKLYQERNYEMATFCFERAGDTHWERKSKAAGLKAMADGIRTSKPKEANSILREAAEIYEAIGMAVPAAKCFSDLGEYERAGRIYLEKCGESELRKAGECFYLGGCYKLAADVYARGNFFAECLNVCSEGKLFEKGLEYIKYWNQHAKSKSGMDKIEQEFLENCALHYHKITDKKSMMKFVKAFHSMDLIRPFLRSLGCLDELLLVEKESENFLEAANIAKIIGDVLVEVDMLGKAGNFKKAVSLIILHILASSLWSQNRKGWPFKKFKGMEELLTEAKSFAKNETKEFFDLVCVQADLFSNEHIDLPKMKSLMQASQRHESVTGEILSAWKILEAHLSSMTAKYTWEDELLVDLTKYSEDLISKDQVSVESLGYFWNLWKDSIFKIFEYFGCLGDQVINKYPSYGDFCLKFLGVRTHVRNHDILYILLESHSYWAKDVVKKPFGSTGKLVSIDVQQLVSSSRSYWGSELVFVGFAVLHKLEVLYDFIKNSNSIFYKTRTLIHILEVGKFLSESQSLGKSNRNAAWLQHFIRFSTKQLVDLIFQLDWHNSLSEKMVILRSSPLSMDQIRNFLSSSGCLDKLLLVEKESENFMEAANIAKMIGDILVEVDMLGKAGNFKKAASLIILHVLASSLWSQNRKGWPFKKFKGMEELLTEAKSFAKNETKEFFDLVCVEADLFSNEHIDLPKMKSLMQASQRHESVTGEILSTWKILEAHLSSMTAKYIWEDELLVDLTKYSEDLISKDQVSVESLGYFWNLWKDCIFKIFEYLGCLGDQVINKYPSYGDFCLKFLGVRTHARNHDTLYILLESHSYWAEDVVKRPFGSTGKLVSIDVQQLVSSSRSYWGSELVFVGRAVLHKLEVLYDFIKNSNSIFYKTRTLIHIHEVGKFLLESQFLKKSVPDPFPLQKFVGLSTVQFVDQIFHLDWNNSLSEKMVILRSSPVSKNILKEFVIENIYSTDELSYGQIGRVAMTIFGSNSLGVKDSEELLKRIKWNPQWKQFFETIFRDWERHRSSEASKQRQNTGEQADLDVVLRLFAALEDAYNANWRKIDDYISPSCFFYLIEYLLIRVSCHNHSFVTTKSFFLQWIANDDENEVLLKNAYGGQSYQDVVLPFVTTVVHQCLFNKKDMIDWIKKSTSDVNGYYSKLVPRLVAITCMVWVNFGVEKDVLFDLLCVDYITKNLPFEFCDVILRGTGKSKLLSLDVITKAFKAIDNPLVIVNLGENSSRKIIESTIYLDLKTKPCKNEMLRKLFPRTPVVSHSHHEATATELDELHTNKPSISYDYDVLKCSTFPDSRLNPEESSSQNRGADLPKDCSYFWEIFEGIKIVVDISDQRSFLFVVQEAKVDVEKCIQFLTDTVTQNSCSMTKSEEKNKFEDVDDMITELKQLSATLDLSETELRNKVLVMEELWKRLQCKRPKVEPILTRLFQQKMDLVGDTLLEQAAECVEEKSNLADERNSSSDGDAQTLANSGPQDSSKCDEGNGSKKPKKNKKKSRSKKKNK